MVKKEETDDQYKHCELHKHQQMHNETKSRHVIGPSLPERGSNIVDNEILMHMKKIAPDTDGQMMKES